MSTTTDPIFTTDCFGKVYSPNAECHLTVVGRSYGTTADLAAILAGCPAIEVDLSADGRGFIPVMGDNDSGEVVYVEKHRADGTGFHGWVDRVSRKIVQVG